MIQFTPGSSLDRLQTTDGARLEMLWEAGGDGFPDIVRIVEVYTGRVLGHFVRTGVMNDHGAFDSLEAAVAFTALTCDINPCDSGSWTTKGEAAWVD